MPLKTEFAVHKHLLYTRAVFFTRVQKNRGRLMDSILPRSLNLCRYSQPDGFGASSMHL